MAMAVGTIYVKGSSLEKDRILVRAKKDDGDSSCSSMGAEVDRTISDVELLRIMECPVCNEFPAPPIFSCEKGHFTCNSCIRLLETCSLCEAPFTKVRNFALESIIENSKFKCRNAHLGCGLIVSGSELNQHVADCLYRSLECKEADCLRSNLTPAEYFSHIVDSHGVSGCDRELFDGKAVVTLAQSEDGENASPYYIKIGSPEDKDSCTVLLFTKRHRTFMCWWASCLEPQKLSKFEVSLSLESQLDEENLSVRWKLPLQPIWKDFDEIRDTGRCAVLPETHLIPYSNKDSWNLKIEVTKKDYTCTNYQHYYPLLLLVLVGIIAVISSYILDTGLSWLKSGNQDLNQSYAINEDKTDQRDFSEEYFGYRGFYYKTD